MNAQAILAIYDNLSVSDYHWIEAEILVRLERYVAFFNYTSVAPFPNTDVEYNSVLDEITEKYNLPRGLWDEFHADGTLGRSFITRSKPLVKKWVRGEMNKSEWEDLSFYLEADLDTDLPFFLYGISHENKPQDTDIYECAEAFGKRNT